jgi:ATP/maltotriose-dependent transcriptional regulator MalT
MTVRGDWVAAEADLGWATSELATLRPPLAGYARARLAELRRRQGRPRDAAALLDEAEGHVLAPLGRAALALDEDDLSGALGHAERYLRRIAGERPVEGAAAWELLVPIHIGRDDLPRGHDAHEQLAGISADVGTDPLRAAERHAAGRLALAGGDADAARRALEDAVDLYVACVEPFESAVARLALAEALAGQDRIDVAREQAGRAAAELDALGAGRASRLAADVVRRLGAATPERGGLTRRELEDLALVASGLSNREMAARLVVSEHTVHRHVANVFTKLGVSSRASAVATAADQGLLG